MSVTGASLRASKQPAAANEPSRFLQVFKRVTYTVLTLSVIVALGIGGWHAHQSVISPDHFPINSVKVEGQFQYIDKAAVQQRVSGYSQSGFLGFDAAALQRELGGMQWVARAGIQRVWPDALVISIFEHTPVARWNADYLFTGEGTVIEPPQLTEDKRKRDAWREHFSALPFLQSEAEKPDVVWQKFIQAREALRGVGVDLHGIHSDRRHAITLVLDNGVSIRLGRGWFDQRLGRFVASYKRYIASQMSELSYVDMRYPNGFATAQLTNSGS